MKRILKIYWLIPLIFAAAAAVLFFISLPPTDFPLTQAIEVIEGKPLVLISDELAEAGVVRSPFLLRLGVTLWGGERQAKAGDYWFEKRLSVWQVALRLARGEFSRQAIRVTIPEGTSVREMSSLLAAALPDFEAEKFAVLAETKGLEGKLFPDTYFFSPGIDEQKVIKRLNDNFKGEFGLLAENITVSGRSAEEILVMASLLEKEAADDQTRRVIAGILWKRLDEGMLLQVDAVFPYLIGKNSFQLSLADLQLDSPYNTYKYPGLPAGPITNPGRSAISAALNPEETSYWYYLSDRQGRTHYAVNFDEHKLNKQRYLR